jgi:hypothetical protein
VEVVVNDTATTTDAPDSARLAEIAASIRAVTKGLADLGAKLEEQTLRTATRLDALEVWIRDAEKREASRANEWLKLVERLRRDEDAIREAQRIAREAIEQSEVHMGAVIGHIGQLEGRLSRQDTDLATIKAEAQTIKAENKAQTGKLDTLSSGVTSLLAAEDARRRREDEAAQDALLAKVAADAVAKDKAEAKDIEEKAAAAREKRLTKLVKIWIPIAAVVVTVLFWILSRIFHLPWAG